MAGSMGLKDAAANGRISLLEPVDEVTVRLPDDHLGAVLGDLSSRRGRVLGTEADEHPGYSLVRAEVPATSLIRYAIDLRSMTSGSATFTRHFVRFDPLPESLVAQVT
jgi:elongation factor G